MDRRITPPKRVTSPTWGPSPPCKQVLSRALNGIEVMQNNGKERAARKNLFFGYLDLLILTDLMRFSLPSSFSITRVNLFYKYY